MVWFVIAMQRPVYIGGFKFQTKLTYGMICYSTLSKSSTVSTTFQTKLTYGMICYSILYIWDCRYATVSN